ncbi:MAG TPA: lysoplasmalogenase family protein, partial [Caulobacterales bacterium]|nr:lysoplasmalogenase family protein [Caulobacterales bacterium]
GQTAFIAGALAFLIGHAIYATFFVRAGLGLAALKQAGRLLLTLALLASAAFSAALLVRHDTMSLVSSAIYTIALTVMVLSSFTLPWTRWLVMLGAVLFFLSDILLTWHANKPPSDPLLLRILSDTSWFTYYFGQLGLCLGALTLRTRA